MRKKIIAGNWKMNKNLDEGLRLVEDINERESSVDLTNIKVILGVPFIHLAKAEEIVKSPVRISAQNCASEVSGAYTGEVSAEMIRSTGVEYVILGHSERRTYYGETNEILAKKVDRAIENEMSPIFCVGEVLDERESKKHFEVVASQLKEGIFHLTPEQFGRVIVAYEPVWAIGTGKTASPKQAQEMHEYIRKVVAEKYGKEMAEALHILYGGSMKPDNAKELLSQKDVDGGLIGGASLKVDDFFGIIEAC